jgi:peptidoglycan hydrolase-like protein with peptidoglycan-binding domain
MLKLSLQSNFVDREEEVPPDKPLAIVSAVGAGFPPRCLNRPDDVRKIQSALNRFSPGEGGPVEKLVADGIAGKLTKAAIRRFQAEAVSGIKGADGIVDIDGPTIRRLRAGSAAAIISNAPSVFLAELPGLIRIVTAAQAALSLASARLDLPEPLGSVPSALEKHFHAKTTSQKRSTIPIVQRVYSRIQAAIGHLPVGRLFALNAPPGVETVSFMFTWAGGFNLPFDPVTKRVPQWEGLDMDRIYITPKGRSLTLEQFRYSMLHELAHFVSGDGLPLMNHDFAYFHRERKKYDALDNLLCLRNADCYSRFAFEVIGRGDLPLPL